MRKQRGEHPDAGEVIERLKAVISTATPDRIKSDNALSQYLSVSQQAVSGWRKKGKVSYDEIVELAYNLIFPISLDEVLLGRHTVERYWLFPPFPGNGADDPERIVPAGPWHEWHILPRRRGPRAEEKDYVAYLMPDHTMSPTIDEGNLVIIDVGDPTLVSPGVYYLSYGNETLLRRLTAGDPVRIVCDNAAFPGEIVPRKKLEILGKAVKVLKDVV